MSSSSEIARALNDGGVVLAPTDTVYGLAARPDRPGAADRIFGLKRRPRNVNLQILLPEDADPGVIGAEITDGARSLLADTKIRAAITFILPLAADRKPVWLAARDEAGVRIPADPRIQAVLAETGPLFATSANAHGRPPGETCPEILAQLDGAPDAVWDVGRLGGTSSTVVNFNADPPVVLRWGVVTDLKAYGLGHA